MKTIKEVAINLKNFYYKMLGYPGIYGSEKLIDDFCDRRIFQFGKYKGKTIASIIVYDRQYVKWCVDNISGFELSVNEQALLEAFNEGYTIHGDKMIIDSSGVSVEPADNDDVDYELLKYCYENN